MFNLLPIPVLDGGHIAIYTVERVRGGELNVKYVEYAQHVALALLILLIIYISFNDILRLS